MSYLGGPTSIRPFDNTLYIIFYIFGLQTLQITKVAFTIYIYVGGLAIVENTNRNDLTVNNDSHCRKSCYAFVLKIDE